MDVPVWLYSLGFLPGLLFMRFFSLPSHPRFFSLRPFYLGRILLISIELTMHGLCGKKDIQGPRYLFAYKQVFAKVVQLRIQKSSCLEMFEYEQLLLG